MDSELHQIALNTGGRVADAVEQAARSWEQTADDARRPHVLMKARVFLEKPGVWCCMYGDCLATDPAGFGDSPRTACDDFDRRWNWSQAQIDKCEAEKGAQP